MCSQLHWGQTKDVFEMHTIQFVSSSTKLDALLLICQCAYPEYSRTKNRLTEFLFVFFILYVCVHLSVCLYITCGVGSQRGQNKCRIPWNQHWEQLRGTMWVLGTKSRFSARTVSAPTYWAIS